ncbi:hypothetical protein CVT25_002401 [Psilocybe cyanescens]|uniref:Uncharacterized protein n=1 Tax=Psilocybe cyanescens TaxID=93625 RepID=A0A409WK77_PSICY|nr:hypothetical protein CVT25_002401 [Psilocybe cyanescens]
MGVFLIDDRDPLVQYLPTSLWKSGGVQTEFNGTTTGTTVTGATATLLFSGRVFGTIGIDGVLGSPVSSYSVDNGSKTIFNATEIGNVQYQQKFFDSGALSPASHTLTITILSNDATYFLDYFTITPTDALVDPSPSSPLFSSSSSSPFSSTTPSSSGATTTGPNSSSGVPLTSSGLQSKTFSTSHVRAIVGGAVGALAFLIFASFAFLFLRKRRRDQKARQIPPISNQSFWTEESSSSAFRMPPSLATRYERSHNNQVFNNSVVVPEQTVIPFILSSPPPDSRIVLPLPLKTTTRLITLLPAQISPVNRSDRSSYTESAQITNYSISSVLPPQYDA